MEIGNNIQFSNNLRFVRYKANLSQQKVSDKLCITRARYSKYEEGASEPPFFVLIKISKYFNVSIDDLLLSDLRKHKQV
ncbi:hypothetical protein AV926_04805 [Myroides marinus]|uniref:HTH cro/C1-type domain-containing protein n=1 Tax=Myroides marinus TaxID=703342 RepID=A0A164A2F1_9FLAO|nr:helix-turn-helix transcriptional regulator [Myroides marinus]KZE82871.1 hypothetical protein AV926_04805 [Myroides marinus]